MVTENDEVFLKKKQKELGLTGEQCNDVIEYIKVGFLFTVAELEFEKCVLNILERENKNARNKK